jgi:hypothetical protein
MANLKFQKNGAEVFLSSYSNEFVEHSIISQAMSIFQQNKSFFDSFNSDLTIVINPDFTITFILFPEQSKEIIKEIQRLFPVFIRTD